MGKSEAGTGSGLAGAGQLLEPNQVDRRAF